MRPLTDFFSVTQYKIAMFRVVSDVNRFSFAFARKNTLNVVLDYVEDKGWELTIVLYYVSGVINQLFRGSVETQVVYLLMDHEIKFPLVSEMVHYL